MRLLELSPYAHNDNNDRTVYPSIYLTIMLFMYDFKFWQMKMDFRTRSSTKIELWEPFDVSIWDMLKSHRLR